MKFHILLLMLTGFFKPNIGSELQCDARFIVYQTNVCKVAGGSVESDESLKIVNASPDKITTLTFTNTNFTSIPLNTFVNFPKVKTFYVYNNNLDRFTENSFQNAKELNTLVFNNNKFTSLPDQTFELCVNLKDLSIYQNGITIISGRPFKGLGKLEKLILDELPLELFDASVLADIPSLLKLTINECGLTVINADFFSNIPNVTDLNLSKNKIVTIEAGALDNLKNLNNLDVTYNMLVTLSTSFAKTILAYDNQLKSINIGSSAISINMNNNFITRIMCDNDLNLQYLYGSKNRLVKIPCVAKMVNLRSIYLDSNRLSGLNKNIFQNITGVSNFEINNNPKLKIGSAMLSKMTLMKNLRVDSLANGYKTLRETFPKLSHIYLTTKNWTCTRVQQVANVLNAQKIYMYFNNFTLDKANFRCSLNSWEVSFFNNTS